MLVGMLPSEQTELAIYKHVDALQSPVHVGITQLSQITGENDYRRIIERLKDLESNNRIRLSKFNGGGIWPRGETPDSTFFYSGSFLIEIVPQGRKYFEDLKQRAEQEGRVARLWGQDRDIEENSLPSRKPTEANDHVMPPKQAIGILRKLTSDAIALLQGEPFGSPKRDEWTGTAQGALERAFGSRSSILTSFRAAQSISFTAGSSDEELRQVANRKLSSEIAVLNSAIEQLGWEVEDEKAGTPMEQPSKSVRLQIFVSHSSKDRVLAEALTDLLKAALGLLPPQILCSSVDGHRLPVGVNTESQLRDDVNAARVVIGLLTPNSLASSFVMFELGARWGAKLFLAPLLAGIQARELGGPLNLQNALSANSESQLHQLLEDISKELEVQLQSPSSYVNHIATVKQLAERTSERPTTVAAIATKPPEPEIRQVGAVNYYFVGDKGPYCQPAMTTKGS